VLYKVVEKLCDAPLDGETITSMDAIAPILLTVNWERLIARAVSHTVKSVTSIKNEKPRLLPPRVFRHHINLGLIKYIFAPVAAYFSLPQSYRLSIHLFARMIFYRIDEIPSELWPDFISLMVRAAKIKFKLPEQVAKVVAILATQLRLALEECYPELLKAGEWIAEELNLLKKE